MERGRFNFTVVQLQKVSKSASIYHLGLRLTHRSSEKMDHQRRHLTSLSESVRVESSELRWRSDAKAFRNASPKNAYDAPIALAGMK
jgi:hypothetical protein